ncbi:MAG: accessory factor UbiK family protein [Pseudomonadota bacterium]
MTQTSNRVLDELAKLMTDAAGVARSVRDEAEVVFRSQAERILQDLDVVQREDYEALKERVADLETRLATLEAKG